MVKSKSKLRKKIQGSTFQAAPVVVFAYRRPKHLRKVLDALSSDELASQTHVKVYVDGPKNIWNWWAVRKTYAVAMQRRPFYSQEVIRRKENLGLVKSIVKGVTESIQKFGKIIVLEDDTVPTKGFLGFMNQALFKYAANPRIFQVAGFRPPGGKNKKCAELSRLTTSWGWGTWRRAWKKYKDKPLIPKSFKKKIHDFNHKDSYPFYQLLQDVVKGCSQSWAIRWYYACYKQRGFVIYPPTSYVENIGFDGSGQHAQKNKNLLIKQKCSTAEKIKWPIKMRNSSGLATDFMKFLKTVK